MPVKSKLRRPPRYRFRASEGRCWEGRFHHKGRPRSVGLGLRMDADPDHGIFKKLDQLRSTYEGPSPRTTLSHFWPLFLTHERSKNRAKTTLTAIDVAIRVHLEPEFGQRFMADVTVDDFEE